jgi:hypothetical protein
MAVREAFVFVESFCFEIKTRTDLRKSFLLRGNRLLFLCLVTFSDKLCFFVFSQVGVAHF